METVDDGTIKGVTERRRHEWVFPVIASMLSAMGGFLFGYDTGVIAGALIQLREYFQLTLVYQEVIVSVTLVSSALAALTCGYLADRFGRRIVIMISTIVFTVGAITLGAAPNKEVLLVGRLVVGIGIGMASTIVPTYIAEIAPTKLRGPLVTFNLVCITGGQFIAALIAGLFISNANGWRYMLGLAGIPSVVQFVGFLFMPESPRWLVEHGRVDEARATLQRIYSLPSSSPQIEEELEAIRSAAARHRRDNEGWGNVDVAAAGDDDCDEEDTAPILPPVGNYCDTLTIMKMLRHPSTRRTLVIGCGIQGFQQLVGINTVMYYGTSILSMAGLGVLFSDPNLDGNFTVVWLATLVALTNFVFSLLAPWLISRFRRRTILLVSLTGVTLSLAVLGVSFQMMTSFSPRVDLVEAAPVQGQRPVSCWAANTCDECVSSVQCGYCYHVSPVSGAIVNGSCLPAEGEYSSYSTYGRCSRNAPSAHPSKWMSEHCPTAFGWMTLVGLILYLAFFAPGMAAVPWAITTEIFPTWARGTGMACSTASNWIANVIVSVSFLSLTKAITRQGTFLLYTCIGILAIVFVVLLVPETGNVMLEDVEATVADQAAVNEDEKHRNSNA